MYLIVDRQRGHNESTLTVFGAEALDPEDEVWAMIDVILCLPEHWKIHYCSASLVAAAGW